MISLLAISARDAPRRGATRADLSHLRMPASHGYEGTGAFSAIAAPDAVRLLVQLAQADTFGSPAIPCDVQVLYWHPEENGIPGAAKGDYDDDYLDVAEGYHDADEPPPLAFTHSFRMAA